MRELPDEEDPFRLSWQYLQESHGRICDERSR